MRTEEDLHREAVGINILKYVSRGTLTRPQTSAVKLVEKIRSLIARRVGVVDHG